MFETILPEEIEQRSFAIIEEELGEQVLNPVQAPVIKRVIHTTADFDYVENLCFSEQAVEKGVRALKDGACIVTDTEMARAGINKRALARFGGEAFCFISDEEVAREAATAAESANDAVSAWSGRLLYIGLWSLQSAMRPRRSPACTN